MQMPRYLFYILSYFILKKYQVPRFGTVTFGMFAFVTHTAGEDSINPTTLCSHLRKFHYIRPHYINSREPIMSCATFTFLLCRLLTPSRQYANLFIIRNILGNNKCIGT
jgi:hypothetical protein